MSKILYEFPNIMSMCAHAYLGTSMRTVRFSMLVNIYMRTRIKYWGLEKF